MTAEENRLVFESLFDEQKSDQNRARFDQHRMMTILQVSFSMQSRLRNREEAPEILILIKKNSWLSAWECGDE